MNGGHTVKQSQFDHHSLFQHFIFVQITVNCVQNYSPALFYISFFPIFVSKIKLLKF